MAHPRVQLQVAQKQDLSLIRPTTAALSVGPLCKALMIRHSLGEPSYLLEQVFERHLIRN